MAAWMVTTAGTSYNSSCLGREISNIEIDLLLAHSSILCWKLLAFTQPALFIHCVATSNEGLNDNQCVKVLFFFHHKLFAQCRWCSIAFLFATASENLAQRQFAPSNHKKKKVRLINFLFRKVHTLSPLWYHSTLANYHWSTYENSWYVLS